MKIENIKADWKKFELRPTWSVVTSRELAQVLNVSLQTINNWKMRNILPDPEKSPNLHAGRNSYQIAKIRSWLENKSIEDVHWEWITRYMHVGAPYSSIESAQYVARVAYKELGIEKALI